MTKKGKLRAPCNKCFHREIINEQTMAQRGTTKRKLFGRKLNFAPMIRRKVCLFCLICEHCRNNPHLIHSERQRKCLIIRRAKRIARERRDNYDKN